MSDKRWEVRSDTLAWREVGDEIIVLQLSSATYLSINGSGRLLWLQLVDGASAAELADVLVQKFGIEPRRAAGDVEQFLSGLHQQDLLC